MSSPDENELRGDSDVEMNEDNPTSDTIENMLFFNRDMNTEHLLELQEEKEKRKERKGEVKNNYMLMIKYFKDNSGVVLAKANELRQIMGEDIFNTMTSQQRVNYLFYALQNKYDPRSLYNMVVKRGGKKKKKRRTRRKKKSRKKGGKDPPRKRRKPNPVPEVSVEDYIEEQELLQELQEQQQNELENPEGVEVQRTFYCNDPRLGADPNIYYYWRFEKPPDGHWTFMRFEDPDSTGNPLMDDEFVTLGIDGGDLILLDDEDYNNFIDLINDNNMTDEEVINHIFNVMFNTDEIIKGLTAVETLNEMKKQGGRRKKKRKTKRKRKKKKKRKTKRKRK